MTSTDLRFSTSSASQSSALGFNILIQFSRSLSQFPPNQELPLNYLISPLRKSAFHILWLSPLFSLVISPIFCKCLGVLSTLHHKVVTSMYHWDSAYVWVYLNLYFLPSHSCGILFSNLWPGGLLSPPSFGSFGLNRGWRPGCTAGIVVGTCVWQFSAALSSRNAAFWGIGFMPSTGVMVPPVQYFYYVTSHYDAKCEILMYFSWKG